MVIFTKKPKKKKGPNRVQVSQSGTFLTLSIFTCDIYYQLQVLAGLVYAKILLTSSGTIFMFSYLSSLSLNQYLYRLAVVFFFFPKCVSEYSGWCFLERTI